jgi:hypothetical protein
MKFKYLLRGFGVGMVVTAAIMGAYSRSAVADARVAVMKEYGLGDEPILVGEDENTESQETDTTESVSETETQTEETIPIIVRDEPIESEVESVVEAAQATELGTSEIETMVETREETELETAQATDSSEATSDVIVLESVEIAISNGDDSGKVSRKLYNAGIIDNASDFDAYLMQHGYDKKLKVGKKTIYATDTWQQIAEKLINK